MSGKLEKFSKFSKAPKLVPDCSVELVKSLSKAARFEVAARRDAALCKVAPCEAARFEVSSM